MSLVEYLREKLEAAKAGCSCPSPEFLASLSASALVLTNCIEHGYVRTQGGPKWGWAR